MTDLFSGLRGFQYSIIGRPDLGIGVHNAHIWDLWFHPLTIRNRGSFEGELSWISGTAKEEGRWDKHPS
jgi:hypothetical protein